VDRDGRWETLRLRVALALVMPQAAMVGVALARPSYALPLLFAAFIYSGVFAALYRPRVDPPETLSEEHVRLLNAIADGFDTIRSLAEWEGVSWHAIRPKVAQLEALGLVKLEGNRRNARLVLTEAGQVIRTKSIVE